jgi:hypothetical protein
MFFGVYHALPALNIRLAVLLSQCGQERSHGVKNRLRAFLVRQVAAVRHDNQLCLRDLPPETNALLGGHYAIIVTRDDQGRDVDLLDSRG